jgi:hypothetical protein
VCLGAEGRGKWDAHIKVPNELAARVPVPEGDEARLLAEVADPASLDVHSRLGSRVVLGRELDGTLLALGDLYPWRTL